MAMSKALNNPLKELKKLDLEYLTIQLINAFVNIKLIEYGVECLDQENKEYEFNFEVSSKLFLAGGNPGVGWYRCIKCNNQVFIAKNRDMLHDCAECNGYQFRQI